MPVKTRRGRIAALLVLTVCGWLASLAPAAAKEPKPSVIPPPALHQLESCAEALYNAAFAANTAGFSRQLAAAHAAWTHYQPHVVPDIAPKAICKAIDSALASLDHSRTRLAEARLSAARAANAITGQLAALLHRCYLPRVPADVTSLGYLGREVELDVEAKSFAQARQQLKALKDAWSTVRPKVVAKQSKQVVALYGAKADVAAGYDDSLRAIERALSHANGMRAEIALDQSLDALHRMAKLFEMPH